MGYLLRHTYSVYLKGNIALQRSTASLLAAISLTAALSFALPKSAAAMPPQGWVFTTTEGGSANLRAAPSTSAKVGATARNGSQFEIAEEQLDSGGLLMV